MKPAIVIDKSYANRNSGKLSRLAIEYTLVVPTAFYYEVFTTSAENRVRELKNFPPFKRIHLSTLLKQETETGEPVKSVSRAELSFDPEIATITWQPTPELAGALRQHDTNNIVVQLEFLKDVVKMRSIPGFSEGELAAIRACDEDFIDLCVKLRDPYRIQRFAEEIGWIHAAKINSQWIYYRYFQALVMKGFILLRRYPNPGDVVSDCRLEHDIQDLEYLTLGLHVNALATAEVSNKLSKATMSWRFRVSEPKGHLIIPNARHGLRGCLKNI